MIQWFTVQFQPGAQLGNDLGQVVHTHVPLFTKQYKLVPASSLGKVMAVICGGLALPYIRQGRVHLVGWQIILCDSIWQVMCLRHSQLAQGYGNGDEHHSRRLHCCDRALLTICKINKLT